MALDFLDDALGLAAGAAGIAGLMGASGGKLHGWQERGLKGATKRNTTIAEMLQNPMDPRFQEAVALEEQGIRSGVQSGIAELMTMDRRQRARGLGMLNPERRDEGIASATATAYEQAQQQARNNVRNYLLSAANVNAQLLGGVPSQPLGATGMNPQSLGLAYALQLGQGAVNGMGSPSSGSTTNITIPGGSGIGNGNFGLPSYNYYGGPR
jgi:hypothetical protein